MFQGFYITTQDCMGEAIAPGEWSGLIKKDTPIALTYFDEHGMEFTDGEKEFRLERPCKIVAASSCPYCGKIIWTMNWCSHLATDSNCKKVRKHKDKV